MALFKRLYIAVSRRTTRVMPGVLVAAQETLKLAQAAQLPLCAPAFNIALEILNIFQASHGSRADFWSLTFVIHWQQAVKDSASASNELLQTLRVYNETVGNMVEILSPDYLESSDDVQARIARKSIAEFEKEMASVKTILDGTMAQRTWKKALNNSQIKADIEQCTRKLVAAREKFNSSTMMVILANTKATQLGDFDVDEFRIPGATSLKPTDIKLGSKVTRYRLWDENDPADFWEDTRVAIVRGQKKLAKFYTPDNGGEDAFLRDIQRLSHNIWPNLPSVFGHCRRSSVPFIIFDNSHIERFLYYIENLAHNNPQNAILTVWNMDAAVFLASNDAGIHDRAIEDAIRDPSVNENGEIILSPQVEEEEDPDYYYMLRTSDQLNLDLMVYTGWTGILLNSGLRPLRSLGLALEGDAEAVLNTNISTLEDPSTELRKYWLETRNRTLTWCLGEQGDLAPGDVGVFRSDSQADMIFVRLGSVADELGGVNTSMGESCYHESVSDRIFRVTYDPAGDGEAHRLLHKFGITTAWRNELRDKERQSEYFLRNIQRLSEQYNVPPEELVIVTETSNSIFGDSFEEFSAHLPRPVHSYLHLSNRGHVDQVYWSYESVPGAPFSQEELAELPLPEVEISPLCRPSCYFQVEPEDLEPFSS